MAALWLRFLIEIDESSQSVHAELFKNEETCRALEILRESAYTSEELDAYDRYWDSIRIEQPLHEEKVRMDVEKIIKTAVIKVEEKTMERGMEIAKIEMIINGHHSGFNLLTITKIALLTEAEIEAILKANNLC